MSNWADYLHFDDINSNASKTNFNDKVKDSTLYQLLQLIKNKDRSALSSFFDATVKMMYGLALKITQDSDTAEEVINDTYFQAWKQADKYDSSRGTVIAWLTIICRSRALDAVRAKQNKNTSFIDDRVEEAAKIDQAKYPQDILLSTEENSNLHKALRELNVQQRQLLSLAYFRGYTHSELAQITGLPLGTIKTQIRRALLLLKKIMSETEELI